MLHIRRLRFGDDVPLCLEDASLPADKFPGLLGHDLETSLYATLRSRYQTDVTRTKFEVEAVRPEAQEAEHLRIDRSTPCLRTHTLGQDQHGQIVESTISLYRGDIYRLTFEGGSAAG